MKIKTSPPAGYFNVTRGYTIQRRETILPPKNKGQVTSGLTVVLVLLLLAVSIATIWPELRISQSGAKISFKQGAGTIEGEKGFPRLLEMLALFFSAFALFIYSNKIKRNQLIKYAFLLIAMVVLIRLIHMSGWSILRAGFLLPLLLFSGILAIPLSVRQYLFVMRTLHMTILTSGLIILFQPAIGYELPIDPIYSSFMNAFISARYAGLGQSYSYQCTYLLFGLALSLGYASYSFSRGSRFIGIISIPFLLGAILMTGARTGYVIAFGLILLWLLGRYKKPKWLFFTLMTAAILLVSSSQMSLTYRSFEPIAMGYERMYGFHSGLLNRLDAWRPALWVIVHWPFFGVSDYFEYAQASGFPLIAHEQNSFLATAVYAGLPFLILCLVFYYKIYKRYRQVKISGDPLHLFVSDVFIFVSVVYLFFSMTENIFSSIQVQITFFMIIGVGLSVTRNVRSLKGFKQRKWV